LRALGDDREPAPRGGALDRPHLEGGDRARLRPLDRVAVDRAPLIPSSAMAISIEAWRARGRTVDTPDGRLWAMQTAASAEEPIPVLVLHGFPTCSWDFADVIDRLARRRRVVAFDFLGHGLSEKPAEYGYSLMEQADSVAYVARAFGLERVHLFSHDMGT